MVDKEHILKIRELTDEELAKKLQEVENRAAQEMERRNQVDNRKIDSIYLSVYHYIIYMAVVRILEVDHIQYFNKNI